MSQQHETQAATLQRPITNDPEEWKAYWKARSQEWRTEPEIGTERQKFLAERRDIKPNIIRGIYPFKDIKLSRADVEWLLAMHENGQRPVDWHDENQRGRKGIDMRGADLRQVNLSGLPLACMIGGLDMIEDQVINSDHRKKAAVCLDGANLRQAHLEGAILYNASVRGASLQNVFLQDAKARWARMEGSRMRGSHLEGADLRNAHLEGNTLANACLDGTDLRGAFFDAAGVLTTLGSKETTALIAGIRWGGVDLTRVDWSQVITLGDERIIKKQTSRGLQIAELQPAVRAYRSLAIEMQAQGLNEEAAPFAYRAQNLQRQVFWKQIHLEDVKLRERAKKWMSYFISLLLYLVTGYGYKPIRALITYIFVIAGFAIAYYLLGFMEGKPLSPLESFIFSMISFHGRGFSPSENLGLSNPLTMFTAIEAFVGLIIEVTLIATLTQRLFGK